MTLDLFAEEEPRGPTQERLAEGAVLLRGFARESDAEYLAAIRAVAALSPFRKMITPGGFAMSVAMTNCGRPG